MPFPADKLDRFDPSAIPEIVLFTNLPFAIVELAILALVTPRFLIVLS